MTMAERVARLLGNDGQRWETEGGKTLDDLATEHGAYTERHPEKHYLTRYVFADGSAIVASEGAWDIEGAEPWSWQGVHHERMGVAAQRVFGGGGGAIIDLDWEHEVDPAWDSLGTTAESWYATYGEYACQIDHHKDEHGGGWAYTVTIDGNPIPGGENEPAESFEDAEEKVKALIRSRVGPGR